jgi:hypothetical protein
MWVIPEDLGNFSPKKGEKSWGAKNSRLSASNFRQSPLSFVVIWKKKVFCLHQKLFHSKKKYFMTLVINALAF